jgi:predicted Rossmann fold nucleotide-binding protein DprA/Smf involved in DNA uptake
MTELIPGAREQIPGAREQIPASREPIRDPREVIRDEHLMRRPILQALGDGPLTVPEIARAVSAPEREVVFWVMGLRKYGWLTEIKEPDDDGYFRYAIAPREGS